MRCTAASRTSGALEEALNISHDLATLSQANALNILGRARLMSGDYPGVAVALSIYRGIRDREDEAEALNEAATLYWIGSDLGRAEGITRRP
jgi:hypothetical protein